MVEKVYKFPQGIRKWLLSPISKISYYKIRDSNLEIVGRKTPFTREEVFKSIPIKGRKVKKVRTAFGDLLFGQVRVDWVKEKMKKVV